MRIDDAGPRTWLLAGVAGWALVAWVLALAGMGGRVEPLPPDPSLLQPLPRVRATPPPRLGSLNQYSEIANRPLFTPNRRPQAFVLQGEGDAAETRAFDYVLTGVLITPRLRLATLQPPDGSETLRVRLGEAPEPQPDWRLVELNERSAVFEGPDGRHALDLRVFDGIGGAAPTAVSAPPRRGTDARPGAVPEETETGNGNGGEATRSVPRAPAPVPASPAKPVPASPTPTPTPPASAPATDQAQMEAIRRRIQERRERLRGDSPTKPPVQSP